MPHKKDDKHTTTKEGLAFCNKLFEIEVMFHDSTTVDKLFSDTDTINKCDINIIKTFLFYIRSIL